MPRAVAEYTLAGVAAVKAAFYVLTNVAKVLKQLMLVALLPTENSGRNTGGNVGVVVATVLGSGGVGKLTGTMVGDAGSVVRSIVSAPMWIWAETSRLSPKLKLKPLSVKVANEVALLRVEAR